MSHFVHVAKRPDVSAFHHDTDASIYHGGYAGVVHHGGSDHRAYKFSTSHDAKQFHAKVTAAGHKASIVEDTEIANEGASFNHHLAEYIFDNAAFEPECYQAFVEMDEAMEYAKEASALGINFSVGFSEEHQEFRVGPVDDVLLWSLECEELVGNFVGGKSVDEGMIHRHSTSSRLSRSRVLNTTQDAARRKVSNTARLWRLSHKSKIAARKSLYHRPNSPLENAIEQVRLGKRVTEVVTILLGN